MILEVLSPPKLTELFWSKNSHGSMLSRELWATVVEWKHQNRIPQILPGLLQSLSDPVAKSKKNRVVALFVSPSSCHQILRTKTHTSNIINSLCWYSGPSWKYWLPRGCSMMLIHRHMIIFPCYVDHDTLGSSHNAQWFNLFVCLVITLRCCLVVRDGIFENQHN